MKLLSQLLLCSFFVTAGIAAQGRQAAVEDFVGTWNIEVMSHQIALVIEKQDATRVTATMMMMGRDIPLKGELVDRTITLTGIKSEADPNTAASGHGENQATPRPIVVTLQDDGTLSGEMMTSKGPAKWTGEKLRTRKRP